MPRGVEDYRNMKFCKTRKADRTENAYATFVIPFYPPGYTWQRDHIAGYIYKGKEDGRWHIMFNVIPFAINGPMAVEIDSTFPTITTAKAEAPVMYDLLKQHESKYLQTLRDDGFNQV